MLKKVLVLAFFALFSLPGILSAQVVADSVLQGDITASVTLSANKIYMLRGFVVVKSPATLSVEAGTLIVGEKSTKGSLIIDRGAKIFANGSSSRPIVFTSEVAPGQRGPGDWGGIIVVGRAGINLPGGEGTIEGGVTDAAGNPIRYGGGATPNDDDSSGVIKYVRIEYSGIAFQPNNEINGLTMGGVGRKTLLEYVQVSYCGDDSFEWFGGTVNGKYLISLGAIDDDFDTDNGYRGKLQFLIALRDPQFADVSGSHAMEADNDAGGTFNTPRSNVTISNATFVGPMSDTSATGWNPNFRRGGHWRRSTLYGLFNSVVMGWPDALLFDGNNVANAANADTIALQNTIFAGNKGGFKTASVTIGFNPTTWAATPAFGNTILAQPADAMLSSPFTLTNPDLTPKTGSPALSGASFTHSRLDAFFTPTSYKGAFGSTRWDLPWANYNSQTTNYGAIQVIQGDITSDLTLSADKTYLLRGFVVVKSPAAIFIPAGTVILGEKSTKGTLIIDRGAKIMAAGTASKPIVFTSAQPSGTRAPGDWGGIIVVGRAGINLPGGEGTIEGGVTDAAGNPIRYGGGTTPNDDDSSGVLRYVRLEYPGIAFQPNNEINGLTMGGVGRKTVLEYVQVSYCGDDSFEWFGGTVNGKYLISLGAIDDDFDTDNGYRGQLQFLIALRDPQYADISGSHAMEADNDAGGTFNTPRSNVTISNATFVGPMPDTSATGWNPNFRRGGHWRRSTLYGLFNSVIIGWPDALLFDGNNVANAAAGDTIALQNTIFAGNKGGFKTASITTGFNPTTWAGASTFNNTLLPQPTDAQLENPFNLLNPGFLPKSGSPALSGASFSHARLSGGFFTLTTYRGAFGSTRWDLPWANYNPQGFATAIDEHDGEDFSVPSTFTLHQNYPNPFNPSTIIAYTLPQGSLVTLRIYDMLGREIRTLVDGFRNAGTHKVSFEAGGLPSGMYLYRLTTDHTSEIRKMMLLK